MNLAIEPDAAATVPLISNPANELADLPVVTVELFERQPYMVVHGIDGRPAMSLSPTDALNLAVLLILEAGAGMNRQLARALPQVQEQVD